MNSTDLELNSPGCAAPAKAAGRPHVLVMTASPVPRAVAITVFGDLDVSVLTELPAGRAAPSPPCCPRGLKSGYVQRTWQRVREEVETVGGWYVVCPRISSAGQTHRASTALDPFSMSLTPSNGKQHPWRTLRDVPSAARGRTAAGLRIDARSDVCRRQGLEQCAGSLPDLTVTASTSWSRQTVIGRWTFQTIVRRA